MKKRITITCAVFMAAALSAVTINIRPTCCRFIGWRGVELSAPAPTNGQSYVLQYRTNLSAGAWINVPAHPDFGPFVEDGVWRYYDWNSTNTGAKYWRIVEGNPPKPAPGNSIWRSVEFDSRLLLDKPLPDYSQGRALYY